MQSNFQFDGLTVDPALTAPLYWQLYTHLRDSILAGRLKRGTKLPSSRALAGELNLSRNTVLNAYQQLEAEGYLESVEASGTFVASVLPDLLPPPAKPSLRAKPSSPPNRVRPRLSHNAETLLTAPTMSSPFSRPAAKAGQRAFSAGEPALDAFPFDLWGKIVARRVRHVSGLHLIYQDSLGYRPLREAIAEHMTVTRRVNCTADQIVITAGSQGALDLIARLLLNPGDPVWMEDPGYLGARGALAGVGAKIIPIPVDDEGLNVETGIARCPAARLVYLTPSHQFPLGVTMSLARRLAILDWAKRANAYIIEDDYDSEYRFAGKPLAALQGLDNSDCVIYIGTFSKVLFPSLRLGYLILPPALVEAVLAARRFIDIHPPLLEQAVLTDFIAEGHFARHLRRMRNLYAQRRTALLKAMQDLPLDLYAAETGMHCIGWLPGGTDDKAVAYHAAQHNVDVTPLSKFSVVPMNRKGLLLGYAAVDVKHIREAACRLALALTETGTIK